MIRRTPPKLATAFLKRLGPKDDGLVGEYALICRKSGSKICATDALLS
jgi:hypothetical protein